MANSANTDVRGDDEVSRKNSGSAIGGLIILAIALIVAFIKWILAIAVFGSGIFLVLAGMQQQNNWVPQWAKKFSPDTLLTSGILVSFLGIVFLSSLFVSAFFSDEKNSSAQSSVEEASNESIPIEMADEFEADENGHVKIYGKTEPGALVELYKSSSSVANETVDNQGNFSFDVKADTNTTVEYQVKAKKDGKTAEKRIVVVGPTNHAIQLAVDTSIKTTKDQTPLEGTTEPGAKVTLKDGDKVLASKKANSDGEFKFTLPTSNSEVFTLTSEKTGYEPKTEFISVERTLSKAEQKARYKKSCKNIAYKQLKKNPDKYAGERYKAHGQILQIMEGFGQTEMRIAVTKDSWGYWNYDDVIYVTYEGTTDFVEEDVVTIYGEITGSYSYTSIAGWEITVPGVNAKYIEK